ncbi:MAG: FMN-binding negative transcriptional regulator [Oceanicoccus sp.]
MYIPSPFEIRDIDEIFSFIEAHAFGQLISTHRGKLYSTHMPLLLSDDKTKLLGHVAKHNPQHQDIENQQVMVTLEGPHDYISPSWYSAPGVPTWNYQALHIYGRCKVSTDSTKIIPIIEALTKKNEMNFDMPWVAQYPASMLGAIVAIDISIDELQCKYKLSQNRSDLDRDQVIAQLDVAGSSELAAAMKASQR